MIKVYKKLTDIQIMRGVVFSSTLSKERTEQPSDRTHEVLSDDKDKTEHIERLLNDSFFNASPWRYNVVRK